MARPSLKRSPRWLLADCLQLASRRLGAVGGAVREDMAQRRAGPHLLRGQPVHLRKAVVGDDQALARVEHGKPLEHIAERGVEQQVLLPEPGVGALELAQRAIEEPEGEGREHEVGRDPQAEAGEGDEGHLDQQRAQAVNHLDPTHHDAAHRDRRDAGVSRRSGCISGLEHRRSLRIDDALEHRTGGATAHVDGSAKACDLGAPIPLPAQNEGCGPRRAQVGLVGERLGVLPIVYDAITDGDQQGGRQRQQGTERAYQAAHRDRAH
jgi:hypothetical protein